MNPPYYVAPSHPDSLPMRSDDIRRFVCCRLTTSELPVSCRKASCYSSSGNKQGSVWSRPDNAPRSLPARETPHTEGCQPAVCGRRCRAIVGSTHFTRALSKAPWYDILHVSHISATMRQMFEACYGVRLKKVLIIDRALAHTYHGESGHNLGDCLFGASPRSGQQFPKAAGETAQCENKETAACADLQYFCINLTSNCLGMWWEGTSFDLSLAVRCSTRQTLGSAAICNTARS